VEVKEVAVTIRPNIRRLRHGQGLALLPSSPHSVPAHTRRLLYLIRLMVCAHSPLPPPWPGHSLPCHHNCQLFCPRNHRSHHNTTPLRCDWSSS
jgi:hypothetical protein